MNATLYHIDAFADRPFTGNPAAVVLLDAPADADWMQAVAAEMNLSETAFVHRARTPEAFTLRWFTPVTEVELCGHATLAGAHALWEHGALPADKPAVFETRSGTLTARGSDQGVTLDFPADPPRDMPAPERGPAALGAAIERAAAGREDLLLELADARAVRDLKPDLRALAELPYRGVIVTARAEPGGKADFVSRFFAPRCGIAEDPVTGSAHCTLGPYWQPRLGKAALIGRQLSARGGSVAVRLRGDRVELTGRAVTVARGILRA